MKKLGFLQKKIVPLPTSKMGSISGESVILKEELTDSDLEGMRVGIRTERH